LGPSSLLAMQFCYSPKDVVARRMESEVEERFRIRKPRLILLLQHRYLTLTSTTMMPQISNVYQTNRSAHVP
jgi:hypothetical protein